MCTCVLYFKTPPKDNPLQLVYHQWDEQHPTLIESQTHDINKINMNFVYQDNISSTASFMWNTNGFKGLWYIIWHLHVMKAQISLSEYQLRTLCLDVIYTGYTDEIGPIKVGMIKYRCATMNKLNIKHFLWLLHFCCLH